jgi:hypothetical protein
MLDEGALADRDDGTRKRTLWQMDDRIRMLERQLGRPMLKVEI